MRNVLSNSWTAVVEKLIFAAVAVKECLLYWGEAEVVVGAVVCAGVGVPQYQPHHRSPSCLPGRTKLRAPADWSGPLFLTLSELKPESVPPVSWR